MSSKDIDDTLVDSTTDSSLALNTAPPMTGTCVDFDDFKAKHWNKKGDADTKFRGYLYERMRERGWDREKYARDRLNISGGRLSDLLVGKQLDGEQADRMKDDLGIDVSRCRRGGNLGLKGRHKNNRPVHINDS